MSRTSHPRIPGTHRALTKAERVDLDYVTPKHKMARRAAKVEIEGEIIAAQLDASEPAITRDPGYGLGTMPKPSIFDRWGWDEDESVEVSPFDLEPEERMTLLSKALLDMSTEGEPWEERLADWEYDLLLLADQTGVTYSEYADEFLARAQAVDELVWSSEIDDADVQAELEQIRMEEAAYDGGYGGYSDDPDDGDHSGCWLPLVTLYDPTGAREDCYDVFGGDGFIIEGGMPSGRPEGRKQDRDEWTVVSLARAWDVETSIMVAMLEDTALGNQSGLTTSSRVPMHVISDQMEATIFGGPTQRYQRSVMWVWNALMMGYTDTPANRRMGTAARQPDAKRLKGDENTPTA